MSVFRRWPFGKGLFFDVNYISSVYCKEKVVVLTLLEMYSLGGTYEFL